ncbi:MAG TPA: hypothetical protein VNQ90_19640 [Chthoniobacteraceae bacterium]|nr:hypothetical protein [Chthoniobacteraceae bacterium]
MTSLPRWLSSALAAITGLLLLLTGSLFAEEMPGLLPSGVSASSSWVDLGSAALPQHTRDLVPWKEGVPAQSGDVSVTFRRLSGSGYAAAPGLYSGSADYVGPLKQKIFSGEVSPADLPELKPDDFINPGVFQVSTASPAPKLQTVAFLIRIKGFPTGKHFTPFELMERIFPATLSYNQGEQALTATRRKRISSRIDQGFPEEIYALEWDLAALGEPVREFRLQWVVYPHSCMTGLRVEQAGAPLQGSEP